MQGLWAAAIQVTIELFWWPNQACLTDLFKFKLSQNIVHVVSKMKIDLSEITLNMLLTDI